MGRPNGGPRMGELRELVLRDYTINGKTSIRSVERCFKHLARYFKVFPIEDAHEASVRYILERTADGAAAATIRNELTVLGRALTLAARSKRIPHRPHIVRPTRTNVRRGFVSLGAIRPLLRELPEPVRSITQFAYITGWRRSEVLGLTWDRVDFEAGTVRLEPGMTKNRDGRTYPFRAHPELRRLLERLYLERNGPYVFHRKGRDVRDFRWVWKKACEASGLGGTVLHDLKRSAVRNLERAGVPRSVAMALVGHKTESIYKRYAIVDEHDLARGVRLLAKLRNGHHGGEEKGS